ncbi:gamma-glutamyl-gamma-aminobutyrate hydrolase family protein [Acidaminobacter sp. JC074]|uniref:gamma-glutamyl-gamma-aminobutyrate hydrolase family protein n=1 Tax=Acidaminobacter sp. JC074 TaxID=2530199 RepID=UPI001F0D53AC|nr:gamma-glutamyl-gamma-aminobutyrate hydrolase family protein [Acidaminobacter sp. JC074]MCH4889028.1 gamma-glutamyl-gamma-aminobutyrate hydrolase family protein [Acidaminobacter sp. JC074]
MKPLIGISSYEIDKERGAYITVNDFYSQAVIAAGGIPVVIPTIRQLEEAEIYAKRLDGLVLTGGNENISPRYYEKDLNKEIDYINPPRDEWEIALIKFFENNNKPILGICRGMQLINVSRNGSLFSNVHNRENSIGHFAGKTNMKFPVHTIKIEADSKLYESLGHEAEVNSYHYQGINGLGDGLKVVAMSRDGLIEAIEDDSKKFLQGVQWHPEAMIETHSMKELFSNFIKFTHPK